MMGYLQQDSFVFKRGHMVRQASLMEKKEEEMIGGKLRRLASGWNIIDAAYGEDYVNRLHELPSTITLKRRKY
jgi:hypothetical protein